VCTCVEQVADVLYVCANTGSWRQLDGKSDDVGCRVKAKPLLSTVVNHRDDNINNAGY